MLASRPSQARQAPCSAAKSSINCNRRTRARAAVVDKPKTESWEEVAEQLEKKSPLEIMDHALSTFGTEIAIAFSGAEDVALVEYAHLTGRKFRVFSLDTGRLNPETYELFDAVEKRYGIRIEYTFPEAQEVMDLVREKGLYSFYEDGHQECCRCWLASSCLLAGHCSRRPPCNVALLQFQTQSVPQYCTLHAALLCKHRRCSAAAADPRSDISLLTSCIPALPACPRHTSQV